MNLPNTAKVDRFIAKKIFIDKIPKSKAIFKNIDKITWGYKLSPKTINIPSTLAVDEIHIFEIVLKSKEIPTKALMEINSVIPYPVLFRLTYNDASCYAISLLDNQKHYISRWDEDIEFEFKGTNLEKVYENIVKKFLKYVSKDTTLKFGQIIQNDMRATALKKDILALQKKIKIEKQFKKQLELSRQLKPKEKELKGLE